MAKYVMALDAGTTSNRCILFNEQGEICSMAQKEFRQFFPNPGWVEHDANEIWSTMLGVAVEAMNMIRATAADIAAIGITNQREILISSKNHHEQLGNELHILLQKYGDTTKDPGVIAKGMSWIKTNAKLAIDDSDRVCADLITDGCHMGTKTMQRHINQYLAADREARGKAEELIRMEELLACELKPFL